MRRALPLLLLLTGCVGFHPLPKERSGTAVDAAALRRFAARLLKSGSPSLAALGPVKGLESYDRFAARFG